jgi:hypothetical protein
LQPVLKENGIPGRGKNICNACGARINGEYEHSQCRKFMHEEAQKLHTPEYEVFIAINNH